MVLLPTNRLTLQDSDPVPAVLRIALQAPFFSKIAWGSGWKKNKTLSTKACHLIKCISTNTIC